LEYRQYENSERWKNVEKKVKKKRLFDPEQPRKRFLIMLDEEKGTVKELEEE